MSETITVGTPKLNKALAAVQASLPKVSKDQEGKVQGEKDGRRYSYTYKYADLAELSEAILPLLGKNGLAFTAMPGLNAEGKFGLTYSLVHESGEEKGGFYPIVHGTPQQNGSAITYARRYCLGAVTGVAPAEDDDGAAANQVPQSAGDAWDQATPAPVRRQQDNGHAQQAPQSRANVQDDQLGPWAAKLDEITSQDDANAVAEELERAHRGGLIDSRRATAIRGAIRDKAASLNGHVTPKARPEDRGAKPVPTGSGDDGEWVQDFAKRLTAATDPGDLPGLQRQVGAAVQSRKISPAKATELVTAIRERRSELSQGAAV